MTKTNDLSRRKLLGRIGILAAAGYSVPALTTLSMAQAGSGASGGGKNSGGGGDDAAPSAGPSNSGTDDTGSTGGTGGGTATDPAVVLATCGPENLNDPVYLQCLVDNGF